MNWKLPELVVITGASGGIGASVAKELSSMGCEIEGWDVNDGEFVSRIVDLSSSDGLSSACDSLLSGVGVGSSIGLVHCAGVQLSGGVGALGGEEWIRALGVNVLSVDAIVQSFLGSNRGPVIESVVCVGSVHVRGTTRKALPYAVTKHALWGWVRSAALELGVSGTRVNMVSPGAVDTDMLRDGLRSRATESRTVQDLAGEVAMRTPLRRLGVADDIAGAVAFLLSDQSLFVTGCDLVIDGGVTAQLASEG
ncbi:SDR family NAD(P)-dependent oxidoreductase [Gordonia hongkongensis]|uniref:SDR family NAD(P)-dependent oxidoreductase n=1 Tax=Gordonia hongkongensis TaxID=1701090 RepID=UPI003D721DB3